MNRLDVGIDGSHGSQEVLNHKDGRLFRDGFFTRYRNEQN